MSKVLVIAAHPDDEILGCGATMIEHVRKKDKVGILIASEGVTSRDQIRDFKKRKKEIIDLFSISKKIAKKIGVNFIQSLSLPDNRLDGENLLDVIKKVEKVINKFKPDIIYTHHPNDLNIDHSLINKAVLTAVRPTPKQTVRKIYAFEILSSTNWSKTSKNTSFIPNYFNEVTKSLSLKIKYIKMYKNEMRKWPHARSTKAIKSLAYYRGSTVGINAAEAFELLREIKKNN
jgi:LmbE family N-acetylglucosaminyl deacetylase